MKGSNEIIMKPIGVIHTSFKDIDDHVPVQGHLAPSGRGMIEVFGEFSEGLKDLEDFSHIYEKRTDKQKYAATHNKRYCSET